MFYPYWSVVFINMISDVHSHLFNAWYVLCIRSTAWNISALYQLFKVHLSNSTSPMACEVCLYVCLSIRLFVTHFLFLPRSLSVQYLLRFFFFFFFFFLRETFVQSTVVVQLSRFQTWRSTSSQQLWLSLWTMRKFRYCASSTSYLS